MLNLREIQFSRPKNQKTFTINSDENIFVFRQPYAGDFADMEDLKQQYKDDNAHYFYLAVGVLLCETLNGKRLNPADIGLLNDKGYAELRNKVDEFQMSLIPKIAKDMIPDLLKKYIANNESPEII